MRSLIYLLSRYLYGENLTIQEFPDSYDIRIIGLSDWEGYASLLCGKFQYTNTFYHKEPKLDITNISFEYEGAIDVLISSDVYEHVMPPVSKAFNNSYKMLKKGGALILTVPFTLDEELIEHYHDINSYEIETANGKKIIQYYTNDGKIVCDYNPTFHGGDGDTLEMRVFSKKALLTELSLAGFKEIKVLSNNIWQNGIIFNEDWSLPLIAKK